MTTTPVEAFVSKQTEVALAEILGTLDNAEDPRTMTSMHDRDGVYTWVSTSSKELLGYDPIELVGRSAWEFIHLSDHPDTRASQWNVHSGKSTKVRYRLRRADGEWQPVESVAWESPDFGTVVVTTPLD